MGDLKGLTERIDEVDERSVQALAERMDIARLVGQAPGSRGQWTDTRLGVRSCRCALAASMGVLLDRQCPRRDRNSIWDTR